jgi:hypothetical protein
MQGTVNAPVSISSYSYKVLAMLLYIGKALEMLM